MATFRRAAAAAAERWPELVEAATFARMRERAGEVMPNSDDGIFVDSAHFFFKGGSGQWRSVLDEDCLRRYDERVGELAAPELVAWLHGL